MDHIYSRIRNSHSGYYMTVGLLYSFLGLLVISIVPKKVPGVRGRITCCMKQRHTCTSLAAGTAYHYLLETAQGTARLPATPPPTAVDPPQDFCQSGRGWQNNSSITSKAVLSSYLVFFRCPPHTLSSATKTCMTRNYCKSTFCVYSKANFKLSEHCKNPATNHPHTSSWFKALLLCPSCNIVKMSLHVCAGHNMSGFHPGKYLAG